MLCIRLHYTNMFKELTVVWSTESKSCAGLNPPPYPLKCFPMSFLVFFPSFTLLCSCLFVCEYAAGSLPLTTGSQLCSPAYIQTLKERRSKLFARRSSNCPSQKHFAPGLCMLLMASIDVHFMTFSGPGCQDYLNRKLLSFGVLALHCFKIRDIYTHTHTHKLTILSYCTIWSIKVLSMA